MSAPKTARIPQLLYGTAWKKDATRALVKTACLQGFRGIDTAAQPKHYQEDLVGQGIRDALAEYDISREDLYIQSKFTSIQGQDPKRMPYDPAKSITDQVNASVASSLRNLSTSNDPYLDCLVLHSPFPSMAQTQEAWRAMESHVPHSIRTLGISNCYHLPVLQDLFEFAQIKPSVIQNRFYEDSGYDHDIRSFAAEKGIKYQSFWTLTANPTLLRSQAVDAVAREVGVSKPVALYGLVLGLGNITILNGTTNADRMKEDLQGVHVVQAWSETNATKWATIMKAFNELLV